MSNPWTHPTMADAGFTKEVRCRCGRRKQPVEMLEVRTLGVGEEYLCGACVEDLLRRGDTDHLTLHARAGAPEDWLSELDTKLRQGLLLRPGLTQDQWGEILAGHLDEAQPMENRWEAQLAIRDAIDVAKAGGAP